MKLNVATYRARYGHHYSAIVRLAIPIMVGQLGVIITGYADTMMVGNYSTQALAAAAFVNSMFNFMNMLMLGFSYGLTPLVGALVARGEKEEAGTTARNAVVTNVLFSLLAFATMLLLYFNVGHLGLDYDLVPVIRPYYMLVLWSMVPVVLLNVLRQFTDATGDTRLAMWIFTAGNVLNIFGNWVLIYGKLGCPELGLNGAGWSTLAARVAMLVAMVWVLMRSHRYSGYKPGLLRGRLQRGLLRKVFTTSFPVSMQLGMETAIFTLATVVVGWFGAVSLAAYQVLVMLGSLGFMIYYAVGSAMSIKIANHVSLGLWDQVRDAAHAGYMFTLLCALFASAVFVLLGRYMVMAFSSDPAVVAVAVSLIWPLVLYQFGDATQVAFANALRGVAQVVPIMRIAAIAYLLVGVPLLLLLGKVLGFELHGIYMAFAVALMLAGLLFMRHFRRYIGHQEQGQK